jgi:arylsulfatase
VHWPDGIESAGETRSQWHHVIDVLPTILELTGIPVPEVVHGAPQEPRDGISMAYSLDDVAAPDRRKTQYFEIFGNRGIYHEGWVACVAHRLPWEVVTGGPRGDYGSEAWELYDTRSDWTEAHDVAADFPQKLEELKVLFAIEAARNQVFPLDDRGGLNFSPEQSGRRDIAAGTRAITYPGSIPWLLEDAVLSLKNRSHAIVAEVELERAGASCVVAAQGGRFGGWSLYLREGRLAYCHNVVGLEVHHVRSDVSLAPGRHWLTMAFHYDGEGVGNGGQVRLLVDGEVIGEGQIGSTVPFLYSFNSKFTIGRDVDPAVTDDYPAGEGNRFAGRVVWVRLEVERDGSPIDPDQRARTALGTH